jgi:hypothetical protein
LSILSNSNKTFILSVVTIKVNYNDYSILNYIFLQTYIYSFQWKYNHIGGVMVSILTSSAIDHGFKPCSGQTKDYKIGICCFSFKHAALSRKSKDLMCLIGMTCLSMDCCFSELALSKSPIKHVGLVQSRHHQHLIEN